MIDSNQELSAVRDAAKSQQAEIQDLRQIIMALAVTSEIECWCGYDPHTHECVLSNKLVIAYTRGKQHGK